ncbi:MAG: IS3 family transposase [Oscillospiraceae bacterium]|nr:IS3 family transposase [Oscillospiraceae bacterium]
MNRKSTYVITYGMSRVGRSIDNSPMKGWWGILKSEMYYLRKFTDKANLIAAIEEYINYYNMINTRSS